MSKKGTKALASATLLSLVLTTALSAGPVKAADANLTAAGKVTRTSGVDRYETAAKVATTNWDKGSKDVVLVCGEGYADAVSGSVLAKTIDAPILLTQSKTLSADTKKALDTLKPENVYVIGGTASIAQSVRDGLKTSGYNLKELGGANRYETNVAVANELVKNHGVKADNVMVVGGEGFSDALSVAPVAAAKGQILLLGSNSQSDMQSVINFVNDNKSKATVVGTNNVMNDSILKALGVDTSARINGGADRFETNLNVLNTFKDDLKADKLYVANATADDGYADALVASALAGKSAAPLVLVDTDTSTATQNALDYISNKANSNTDLNIVGGTGVVSTDLEQRINDAAKKGKPNPNHDKTVKSVESVGLNQLKVTFNTEVDSDSAENVTNYKIDGTALNNYGTEDNIDKTANDNSAKAVLQDDNKTVLITLNKSKEQGKDYTISVKNGVLTEDKSANITAKDQSVTFSDIEAPTVTSVSPKGNSKLTVTFSEPVKIPAQKSDDKFTPGTAFNAKFKINGQSISSMGLDADKSEVKDAVVDASNTTGSSIYVWSNKVDFYFSSKLPTGNDTLKISDGDAAANVLSDAAGFFVKEQEQNFTIDAVTTKPTVKEVTCDPDGTIWVRFDRPMDSESAVVKTNYGLNNDEASLNKNGKLKEEDCTVKFENVPDINTNSNTLYVGENVKDAYGNSIDKDTRVSFTKAKDDTKPTVKNVSMIDSETIRVTFSKDVTSDSATKKENYTLKDSSGVDITNHIKEIKPSSAADGSDYGDDSVWDIKMYKNASESISGGDKADDWRLTSSKYTLTIKNLVDTTSTTSPNKMDEYNTTLNGTDDVAPKMDKTAYAKDKHKVVVTFTEAMDGSTLDDKANYQYQNKAGDSKLLPSGTTITPGNDNKSVTIELPDSYYVTYDGVNMWNADANKEEGVPADLDDDNLVTAVLGSNLKDEAGNTVDSFNNKSVVSKASNDSTNVKPSTFRLEYENSDLVANNDEDIVAKVQFDKNLDSDTLDKTDFTVADEVPDSATIDGSDLKLTFPKGSKADKVKAAGSNAVFKIKGNNTKTVAGTTLSAISGGVDGVLVYDNYLAPKTNDEGYYSTTSQAVTTGKTTTTEAAVVVTFDTPIYNGGVRTDDFAFTVNGANIDADEVVTKGNSLVFIFKQPAKTEGTLYETAFMGNKSAGVGVQLRNSKVSISTTKDADKHYANYVPSDDET